MGQHPLVSVIIPTYNRKRELIRLIESIEQSSYPKESTEIIVVDDSSTDGTDTAVKKEFPDVRVIKNTKRKMTSGSRNIGINRSKGDYLFFVDHDNVIDRRAIEELVNFMESNSDVGLVGPIMYYYSAPETIWCAGGTLQRPMCIPTHIFQYKRSDKLPLTDIRAVECEFIPNAFMVRRQIINEIGFFDEENFPILWEDIDFSFRIKQRGHRIAIIPEAKTWHDVSTAKDFHIDRERAFFRGRNRARFYLKYAPSSILLLPIDMLGFCGTIFAYDKGPHGLEKLLRYLEGIIHGLVQTNSTEHLTKGQP